MKRAAALAALLVACGGARPRVEPVVGEIERVRAAAQARPSDPAAWRALAEWELYGAGGRIENARAAIDHAASLAPDDPVVLFLSGAEHELHGRMAPALDAWLGAVDAARGSADPVAPAVAEAAIQELRGVTDEVPSPQARITEVMERVVREPGALGMPAREAAAGWLVGEGYRTGDPGGSRRAARAIGCVPAMRTAGPFGPYELLGFDRSMPAEGRGPLAAAYDLGPNRGMQPTQETDVSGCVHQFDGGALSAPGTWVAEATLHADAAGPHVLLVDSAHSIDVRIDGVRIARVDRRRELGATYSFHPIQLAAGDHELEIVLSSRAAEPQIIVALDRPHDGYDPLRGTVVPAEGSPAVRPLAALVAQSRGDRLGMRELLLPALGDGATVATLVLGARAAFGDPFLPDDRRRDLARQHLERAYAADPGAWYAAVQLAFMQQGARESIAKMREAAERFPLVAVHRTLARLLEDNGFEEDAHDEIASLYEHAPWSCAVLGDRFDALRARMRYREAGELVDPLVACDATSRVRYQAHLRERRWDLLRAEIERLRPLVSDEDAVAMDLALAMATGDTERELALRAADAAQYPLDDDPPLLEADRLLESGDRQGALRVLAAAHGRAPRYMAALRRPMRALAGTDWLDAYRVDGDRVIDDFEKSGRTYEEHGQVLVFDYMVVRIYPDRSSTKLVHQILRVQSEESIQQLGQMQFHGRLLRLRSIKPDGRTVEPDDIEGLDHVEMPNLAIGDYVEYEYVIEESPRSDGSQLFRSWLFQSYSQPFDVSTFVVVTPPDMQLDVETRGPVPQPTDTQRDGLRVRTWTMRESRPLVAEPATVPIPPRIPTIAIGVGARYPSHLDAVRGSIADRDLIDPAAVRLVRSILGEAAGAPVEERARILHRWVLEHVEPGGEWDGQMALALHGRTGNRTRLLRYLLELAGVRADLVLSRSFGDEEITELLDTDTFDTTLVRIDRGPAPPLFVWAEARGAPFGYLPEEVRGQEAVVLAGNNPRIRLPDQPPAIDRHVVQATITLDEHGGADVSVREEFHGLLAVTWRSALDEVPPAEVERQLESGYTARTVPGSDLRSITIEGRPDPEQPVVFRYDVHVARFGRQSGGAQLLPPLFAVDPAGAWARLPTRESTLGQGAFFRDVSITVRGAPIEAPSDVRLEGQDGALYVRETRRERDGTTTHHVLVVPRMLVPTERYAAFASFCRRVSEAERQEAVVRR